MFIEFFFANIYNIELDYISLFDCYINGTIENVPVIPDQKYRRVNNQLHEGR